MRTILAYASALSDFNFYSRLQEGLSASGFELQLITGKPSLLFRAIGKGIPCRLIKNSKIKETNDEINKTIEVCSREYDTARAARFFYGVREILDNIEQSAKIDFMLIWNGSSLPAKAMSMYAQEKNIKKLFFELSNIPGKLFVDPCGVNAQSLLFQNRDILKQFQITEETYSVWRQQYLQIKSAESQSQHSAHVRKLKNILYPLDVVAAKVMDIPSIGEMNILKKSRSLFTASQSGILYDAYDLLKGSYNFLPLQIQNDSQVLINSKVRVEEAIDIAIAATRLQGRDLLIKSHPLEHSAKIAEKLQSLKGSKGIFIVNAPTTNIVKHCKEIITINSTVGLEGLIAGKKVTFLGESFYKNMSEEQLRNYLLGYLLKVDYYGHESIPAAVIQYMLDRAEWS